MRFTAIWLLFFFGFGSAEAVEYPKDGAGLLKQCIQSELVDIGVDTKLAQSATEAAWLCLAYLEGFRSGIQTNYMMLEDSGIKQFKPMCFPPNTENGRIIRVVTRFLQDNPEYQKQPKFIGAYVALLSAFPCDQEKEAAKNLSK